VTVQLPTLEAVLQSISIAQLSIRAGGLFLRKRTKSSRRLASVVRSVFDTVGIRKGLGGEQRCHNTWLKPHPSIGELIELAFDLAAGDTRAGPGCLAGCCLIGAAKAVHAVRLGSLAAIANIGRIFMPAPRMVAYWPLSHV